jgi:hypothetical protein
MRQMKTRMGAIAVAVSLLSSTAMLGAQDDRGSMAPVATQESLRGSIARAVATLSGASGVAQGARTSHQESPEARRPPSCTCGLPSWVKYSLIAAAGAAGGYALSQIDHHGGHGGFDKDPMPSR